MNRGRGSAIVHEMGCSVDEFSRTLPAAMRDWRTSGGPHRWQVVTADGSPVESIRIEPLSDRRMGALSLPVLAVTLKPADPGSDLSTEFMRRFERGFHRGGG